MRRISVVLFFCLAAVPAVADEPLKLLIFPLNGSSENGGAWVGDGIAVSLSRQLTDTEINLFSRGETEDLLVENGLPSNEPLSRGSMIYIADKAGADFVVLGSYTESEGGLKFLVRLLDVKTKKQGNEFTVSGTFITLPEMENELAWMIYSSVVRTPSVSREIFRERVRRIPNSAFAVYIESLNEYDESRQIQLLEKAVKEYADFAEARFQIGRFYYQKKDYARALPHIEYGRKIPGELFQSEFMIGTCRLQMGENTRAAENYSRLLSLIRHTAALNNLAVAHIRSGNNDHALRALMEAHERDSDEPAIAINLTIARYLAGDTPTATQFIEEAIASYPGNGMLHYLSSFLMKQVGNEVRASTDMARAARFGIDVDKLSREKPQAWMRVILNWTNVE